MKLLIDQNISHKIISLLNENFSDVYHVKSLGLINADDHIIFKYAKENQFDAVITLDDDFVKLLDLFSAPPKIIWLRTGNCSTAFLAEILNLKINLINEFVLSDDYFLFEIFKLK